MLIDRPLCPDGQAALAGTCTQPCLAESRPFVLGATILASAMGFIEDPLSQLLFPR
jgi:hypothetical protein